MPYNTGCDVEKSVDPSSRTRAWTLSVLILRGLCTKLTKTENVCLRHVSATYLLSDVMRVPIDGFLSVLFWCENHVKEHGKESKL